MKNLLKPIILGLIVMLLFSITTPAFAQESEDVLTGKMNNLSTTEKRSITDHIEKFEVKTAENNKELSKENKQIASKSMKNIEKNLVFAEVKDGEKNIILSTDNKKTFVAITDKTIDVVEQVGEYDFLINGERNHFEVTISDGSEDNQKLFGESMGETIQTDKAQTMASWKYKASKWVNINAQRNFSTYTASALGGILGTIMASALSWGTLASVGASLGVGMAYNFVAASQYPTNVGKSHLYYYEQGRSPLTDYKVRSLDYAVYKGSNKFLGSTVRYKRSCVGCGV